MKQEYKDGDKEDQDDDSKEDWFLEVDLTQPGVDIEKLKKSSSGISITPFQWNYKGQNYNMEFISGFAGATIQDDGFIKVQMGWGVGAAKDKNRLLVNDKKKKLKAKSKAKQQEEIVQDSPIKKSTKHEAEENNNQVQLKN